MPLRLYYRPSFERSLKRLGHGQKSKITKIAGRLKITQPSANTLVKQFQNIGILKEITGFKRNRLFVFSEYLRLFEK